MAVTEAATFCATLVDEWVAAGLAAALVAPGSRSTPMALALAAHPQVDVHVFHDERSAAFAALGHGLVSGVPALVLCSSGTAATHFHAAVVEAHLSAVPLLVCTADRPAELHDVGAAQTIDQTNLYGTAVRWFHAPGAPVLAASGAWRSLARRAWLAATGALPGPVHLNLAFREPLVGEPGPLPGRRADAASPTGVDRTEPTDPPGAEPSPWAPSPADAAWLVANLDAQRGVIVAGRGAGSGVAGLGALARAAGWPILADARSGCRSLAEAVSCADSLLRHPGFAADHCPEVVVHVGEPWASRVVNEWLASSGARQVHVSPWPRPVDPWFTVDRWVTAPPGELAGWLAGRLTGAQGTPWAARWAHAERRARGAIAAVVDRDGPPNEPRVARSVLAGAARVAGISGAARVVVASSMPIRDVEWYTHGGVGVDVVSNRGANGIDGTVATAIGAALASQVPTFVLVGDVAFLHDATSLTALARRRADVRVVVVDNDGGGIFSFLPQASTVDPVRFELLYGTPHGTDLVALARAHGLDAVAVADTAALAARLEQPGPCVTVVRSERAANVALHDEIHRAVRSALG